MIFASSNVLGIAVADRAISCAEVSGRGSGRMVRHAATFTLPAELSFDNPDELGQALSRFLRQNDFSASHAVIGVPAKWLLAVEKDVPPASRDQVRSLLRLQAERLPLADSGDLVFDYAGEHPIGKPAKVLLVAMLKKQLERLMAVMDAAGISVVAVTPTGLAVASAALASAKVDNQPMVMLSRHGAEVVWQRQGIPRMLKHFSVPVASNGHGEPALGPLGLELRRAVTLGPAGTSANGQPAPGGSGGELVLLDGWGLENEQIAELSEKVGLKVKSSDGLAMVGVKTLVRAPGAGGEESSPQRYAAAVALAVAGIERQLLPLNFAKSRLAPPPVRRFGRSTVWGGGIAALAFIGIAGLIIDTKLQQYHFEDLQAQRKTINKPYDEAKKIKDEVDFSNLYLKERTPALECMLALTLTFRDDDPIYGTSLSLKEEREGKDLGKLDGTLTGEATDIKPITDLVERMGLDPKFSKVSAKDIAPIASNSRQQREQLYTFSIPFTFDPKPTVPSEAKPAVAAGNSK